MSNVTRQKAALPTADTTTVWILHLLYQLLCPCATKCMHVPYWGEKRKQYRATNAPSSVNWMHRKKNETNNNSHFTPKTAWPAPYPVWKRWRVAPDVMSYGAVPCQIWWESPLRRYSINESGFGYIVNPNLHSVIWIQIRIRWILLESCFTYDVISAMSANDYNLRQTSTVITAANKQYLGNE